MTEVRVPPYQMLEGKIMISTKIMIDKRNPQFCFVDEDARGEAIRCQHFYHHYRRKGLGRVWGCRLFSGEKMEKVDQGGITKFQRCPGCLNSFGTGQKQTTDKETIA